jgi:hypothetical protein
VVGTNDFLWYARNGVDNVNVRLQATYAADGQTSVGHGSGIVSELDYNKTMRQATAGTAWMSQYMAQVLNANIVDDGNLNTHLVQLWDALLAGSYFLDTGSANTIVVAAPPGLTFPAPIAGLSVIVKAAAAPTGATNLNWMGNGNIAVRYFDLTPVTSGDWAIGSLLSLTFDGTFWILANSPRATGYLLNTRSFTTPGVSTYTPTAGTRFIDVLVVGAGCGGTGVPALSPTAAAAGPGGGGGGFSRSRILSGFSGATITVGAGSAGTTGNSAPSAGGSSSFGAFLSATGGQGSLGTGSIPGISAFGGGTAGAGSSGNIYNGSGTIGVYGLAIVATTGGAIGGYGGSSLFGGGGGMGSTTGGNTIGNGNPGSSVGAGGGGAAGFSTSVATGTASGGNGAGGGVFILEYA